ncbi:hypothetical protein OJAV_G00128480 [Oryzias javanicus]|uniref:Uncharacterized protein n=1 Tax=Oryzias javanicus TaxID=123683 RepID=A0A437CQ25_ORYJA|nr:hypothetical protein OJAV_G00128480 [Oryzias javanicus]
MTYNSCILLLLLIGGISTGLPIHFWCSSKARESIMHLQTNNCSKSDVLPSPVLMPYVGINLTEWENKTLQQKHAEVLEAFQQFDVLIQNETSLQCLKRLKNYVAIVKDAPVQKDNVTFTLHPRQTTRGETVGDVLKQYETLIKGKLNYFAQDLQLADRQNIRHKGSIQ